MLQTTEMIKDTTGVLKDSGSLEATWIQTADKVTAVCSDSANDFLYLSELTWLILCKMSNAALICNFLIVHKLHCLYLLGQHYQSQTTLTPLHEGPKPSSSVCILVTVFSLADSAHCECGSEEQTPEHILQTCPHLETVRQQFWPEDTEIGIKLREASCRTTDHGPSSHQPEDLAPSSHQTQEKKKKQTRFMYQLIKTDIQPASGLLLQSSSQFRKDVIVNDSPYELCVALHVG